MENTPSTLAKVLHIWHPAYTVREGNVNYLEPGALAKPHAMPAAQRFIAAAIIAVAIVIGAVFLHNTVYTAYVTAAQNQKSVDTNLARSGALATLPALADVADESDGDVLDALDGAGYQIVNLTDADDNGLSLYRIPDDVSLAEAGALLARGLGSMTASQATSVLNGAWYLSTDRSSGTTVLRYVDFDAGSPDAAVSAALASQDISASSVQDSGVDDAGNTYASGSGVIGSSTRTWKVSAIPFNDVYSISGMPDNAVYVGIRIMSA